MNTIYPYSALKKEMKAPFLATQRIREISAHSIPSPRTNDILSDSVTRIKNGYIRKLEKIALPNSKKIQEFLEALVQAGYIQNWSVELTDKEARRAGPFGKNTQRKDRVLAGRELLVSKGQRSPSSSGQRRIVVLLKYNKGLPAIKGIQILSKPSKRLYFSKEQIVIYAEKQTWGENWTLFLSTSIGIMNHREALHGSRVSEGYEAQDLGSTSSFGSSLPFGRRGKSEITGGEGLCLVW